MKAPQCNTLDNDMRWISALRPLRSGKSHHPSILFNFIILVLYFCTHINIGYVIGEMNKFKWAGLPGRDSNIWKSVWTGKSWCCETTLLPWKPAAKPGRPSCDFINSTRERPQDLCTHMHNKLTVPLSVSAMFNWCLVCVIIESQTEWTGAIWILSCPLFAKFSGLRC